MVKNKKFAIVLALFILGTALAANTVLGQNAESKQEDSATVSGILEAVDVDARTVMITTINGDELVLMLNDESRIQIGESSSDLTQLAAQIKSKVDVDYQTETKTVTVIRIFE